ncbi:tetratricopeptide repeat protein [uncultured Methanomethylovorans sp.]|uniref:tetratricopeptide repeat protein n=1 Tax=uncultured Methanomethylovorans sp. TaxID=183759 RepID=UPI002AA955C7|nr:tetratricopeptide repeat protein [uncultured Methanomethylovorans sp.]
MESAIRITRETEFYQGYIRFKMAVTNESPYAVNEVTLDFVYDDELLRVDRYEPLYVEKKGKLHLGSIDGGKSKSIAVYFDPQMCSKGTDIECNVAYKDYKGKRYIVQMEPKEISVICPIFRTVSDINTGRLKEILERLPHSESCVFEVLSSFDMFKLVNLSREVIEKRNVKHVRTLYTKDKTNYELWYYGKTKVNDDNIVIKLSFLAVQHTVELFAATQTAEALTGLLADVGKDLKVTIESRVTGKGRFNLHLINSKITGNTINNLLDQCNMDGTCDVNIVIDNINERTNAGRSSVNNTNFLNEQEEQRLEAEKQALIKIEQEKQESLQKEKAEKELLRKREEERLRKQREELGRIQAAEEPKRKEEEYARLKKEKERQEQLQKEKAEKELLRQREEEWLKKQKEKLEQIKTAEEAKIKQNEAQARLRMEQEMQERLQKEKAKQELLHKREKEKAEKQLKNKNASTCQKINSNNSKSNNKMLMFVVVFGILVLIVFFAIIPAASSSEQKAIDESVKGDNYYNQGNYDSALQAYDNAIELDVDNSTYYHSKGTALCGLGRYDESLDSYNKALDLDENYTAAWTGKGYALNELSRYDEALVAFDKAIEINSMDAQAWSGKSEALFKLGKYEEAQAAAEDALDVRSFG